MIDLKLGKKIVWTKANLDMENSFQGVTGIDSHKPKLWKIFPFTAGRVT